MLGRSRLFRRRRARIDPSAIPATLSEAAETFRAPMERHASELYARFVLASAQVRGAQPRVQRVLDEIRLLEEFGDRVRHHLECCSFRNLPCIVDADGALILHARRLTVGPWEGTFLVSDDGRQVVGLVFSREPHNYLDLLGDLLVAHALANPSCVD
jgi:hypothetical protein